MLTPALWSALAACFSAVTAIIVMLIQRRNLIESARPELVLEDWEIKTDREPSSQEMTITTIRNVGRGPAFHIWIHGELLDPPVSDPPVSVIPTVRLPVLAAGESIKIDCIIIIFWKNVSIRDGSKYLPLDIYVSCGDCRNVRYETCYKLMASETDPMPHEVTRGVALASRTTKRLSPRLSLY